MKALYHDDTPGPFQGFPIIDDYLRANRKNSVKAELVTVIEEALGVASLAAYIGDSAYAPRRARLWDNIFVQAILGENAALRTELLRCARILELIEWLEDADPLLDTGAGIWEGYMATVLLPEDVFPLALEPLPDEPETRVPDDGTELKEARERLKDLNDAYDEVKSLYSLQTLAYRATRHEIIPDETVISPTKIITHDPLILHPELARSLSPEAKALFAFPFSLEPEKLAALLGDVEITELEAEPELAYVYMPYVHERYLKEVRRLGQIVNGARGTSYVVRTGGSLVRVDNECAVASVSKPCAPYEGSTIPTGSGHIKPIGIAELKVVQSQLLKYEPGEVAHVENVLKGEEKSRTFRNLERSETTFLTEQESTKEVSRETQTTERFELQKETSNVIQQDQAQQFGVSASAAYGPVRVSGYYDSASSTSQAEADSMATNYAKEVMERALERVVERVRAQRTTTTIVEHEDTTLHALKNSGEGAENIAGVYRWLDKLYYNRVVNYGNRLMFEFVVPEPAAFHLYSKLARSNSEDSFQMPPPFDITSFQKITPDNYDSYAALYGATDIATPPLGILTVAANWAEPPGDIWTVWETKLSIPAGYQADHALVSALMSTPDFYIDVCVGQDVFRCNHNEQAVLALQQVVGEVPVTVRAKSHHHTVSVELRCSPTVEAMEKWKIQTYAALKAAHDRQVSEYNRWLAQQGVYIMGDNPAKNRATERTELKKHCISMITGQRFESFQALQPNAPEFGYPEFHFGHAQAEGKYIQFFEQAFEWEQMTYLFYPYFWARKREWVSILNRSDNDPIFEKFLQAGAARVLVPVRPAYYKAILHYLSSGGEVWLGEDVPTPDDPLYVSIIDELKAAEGQFEGGDVEGEPWISKVPTSLVYLQNPLTGTDLPDFSEDLLPE